MITTHQHIITNQRDPSRTTVLRNAFARDLMKRFRELRGVIRRAVVFEDVFGLFITSQLSTPGRKAFAFRRDPAKVTQFMAWLRRQVSRGLLVVNIGGAENIQQVGEAVENAWTNKYILDAYGRGVSRARGQLIRAGFDVPSLDATGGLQASLSAPIHADRLGLLYTRTFNELKGITDAMDQLISRVLTQGIAEGTNPRTLARRLNAVISGRGVGDLGLTDSLGRFIPAERRAQMLARTEIIRAHAEAQLQEFENWKLENVQVMAEWITAGDNRVCAQCEALEVGGPYNLEKARGMLPAHVSCRCAWAPFRPDVDERIIQPINRN